MCGGRWSTCVSGCRYLARAYVTKNATKVCKLELFSQLHAPITIGVEPYDDSMGDCSARRGGVVVDVLKFHVNFES